jgi:hypothetical protein
VGWHGVQGSTGGAAPARSAAVSGPAVARGPDPGQLLRAPIEYTQAHPYSASCGDAESQDRSEHGRNATERGRSGAVSAVHGGRGPGPGCVAPQRGGWRRAAAGGGRRARSAACDGGSGRDLRGARAQAERPRAAGGPHQPLQPRTTRPRAHPRRRRPAPAGPGLAGRRRGALPSNLPFPKPEAGAGAPGAARMPGRGQACRSARGQRGAFPQPASGPRRAAATGPTASPRGRRARRSRSWAAQSWRRARS